MIARQSDGTLSDVKHGTIQNSGDHRKNDNPFSVASHADLHNASLRFKSKSLLNYLLSLLLAL